MKVFSLIIIFLFASNFSFCQTSKTKHEDDKIIVIGEKENQKYDLTAIFYGVDFHFEDEKNTVVKIIKHVVFRNNKTKTEVKYETSGTIPAGEFYFTEIWSPDEEYLILPIGMFEGFGIFKAKDALENIKSNKFFDTIEIGNSRGGSYWHDFGKWENNSTFSFRAGLYGDMFAFKYNLAKSELYCYRTNCGENEIGINAKGKIKATKKGDIAPTKIH